MLGRYRVTIVFLMVFLILLNRAYADTIPCWGSDGDFNIYVKGETVARTGNIFTDWCENGTMLMEGHCTEEKEWTLTAVNCPEDYHCSDGTCTENVVYSGDGSYIIGSGDTIISANGNEISAEAILGNEVTLNASGLRRTLRTGESINFSGSDPCKWMVVINGVDEARLTANISVKSLCIEDEQNASAGNTSTREMPGTPDVSQNAGNPGKAVAAVIALLLVLSVLYMIRRKQHIQHRL